MKERLQHFWESVRSSLWFIPGLTVLAAIAIAMASVTVDQQIGLTTNNAFNLLYGGGAEGARSILSTIAGSMITVAGVVFSITIVALAMASSQFGPRLLKNFMKDTGNQVVLGTFIATFIYCLLILRMVYTREDNPFTPGLSVSIAVLFALANVGVLIYFIHHVSTSIQADHLISVVYKDLEAEVKRLFPEELSAEEDQTGNPEQTHQALEDHSQFTHQVLSPRQGYVQSIDLSSLFNLACKHGLLVRTLYKPGELVITGSPLALVKTTGKFEDSFVDRITDAFIIGSQRNSWQDPEYGINQLVEIALRALSPGFNDPFTAISCIDKLCLAICSLAGRKIPPECQYDDQGRLRVISRQATFDSVINAAFDQIRQYGQTSVAVMIRLLEVLAFIAAKARTTEQRKAIFRQARMIAETSRDSIKAENDRNDLLERYNELTKLLQDSGQG